jgi:hypothetical protein
MAGAFLRPGRWLVACAGVLIWTPATAASAFEESFTVADRTIETGVVALDSDWSFSTHSSRGPGRAGRTANSETGSIVAGPTTCLDQIRGPNRPANRSVSLPASESRASPLWAWQPTSYGLARGHSTRRCLGHHERYGFFLIVSQNRREEKPANIRVGLLREPGRRRLSGADAGASSTRVTLSRRLPRV